MQALPASSLRRHAAGALAAIALAWAGAAQAHCDTLDGPVVGQARQALDAGNVNLVLGWVQPRDEPEIRNAFAQTLAVRGAGGPARELADRSFFETLVRVHRAGEGAPYTGLKPAGHIEPAVAAADQALASGDVAPLARRVLHDTERGLHARFDAALSSRPRDRTDVQAARAHVSKYVEYVHYVEALGQAGATGHGHADAPAGEGADHGH